MRKPFATILDAVGDTPLVRLHKVVGDDAAEVWVKCEFLNPAGSIKDRMAVYIIEEAERRGWLKPGGTIVENTSGNTGLGLAMVAAAKGYKSVFTMPDKMSTEKVNMLKSFGAEVVITPTDVPGDSPDHYVNTAKRIANEAPGRFYVNQYHTELNIEAHYKSTGPEIWEQTGGDLDAFVAGIGTGGTISGVGRFIKERNKAEHKNCQIVGVDPLGSIHFSMFYTQKPSEPFVYKVEGLGEDIVCQAFDMKAVDAVRQVDDRQCFQMARRLTREEGLFCGGSSGGIAHVAIELAREMGPGKKVACVLPDNGSRYISKYLSDEWMKDYGFLEPERNLGLVGHVLAGRQSKIVTASPTTTISEIVTLFQKHGVSQIPIVQNGAAPKQIIHEVDLLRAMQDQNPPLDMPVGELASDIAGIVSPHARVEELYGIFAKDQVAIVIENGQIEGIISQIDLIEYLAKNQTRT